MAEPEITFREMTAADIEPVFTVRTSTVENEIDRERLEAEYGVTPASMAEQLKAGYKGWVAVARDQVVGFTIAEPDAGEVKVLAVLPAYEGHNAGKTLLKTASAWLFDQGHEQIWLLSNPDPRVRAYSFYRRLGWEPTGEKQGDDEVLILTRAEFRFHREY